MLRAWPMEIQNLTEIDQVEILELAAGRGLELEVGTLPHEVRLYRGCARDTVFLSQDSMRHIIQKHGDHIGLEDLKLLPTILFAGFWLSDSRSTHAIVSFEASGVRYKTVARSPNTEAALM